MGKNLLDSGYSGTFSYWIVGGRIGGELDQITPLIPSQKRNTEEEIFQSHHLQRMEG